MKESRGEKPKKNIHPKVNQKSRGITLIALVITVIILIILALIGINAAFGDAGIVTKGQQAKEEAENMSLEDKEKSNSFWNDTDYNDILKLKVTQTVDAKEYKEGDTVIYNVIVKNIGEVDLANVELKDTLVTPSGTKKIPSEFQKTNSNGIEKIGNLAKGEETSPIEIKHIVGEDDLGGELKNSILVTGEEQGNPENKTSTNSIATVNTIGLKSNLEVAKEVISTPKNANGYMVGEEIIYKVTVRNTGNQIESNIIIDDELKALLGEGEEDPIEHWTFDTFSIEGSNVETGELEPGQVGYRIYSYTVQQKDLGKRLINNARIRGKKPLPPGEKEVPTDKPSGTIAIEKQISTEGMLEEHKQEALSHAYTFTLRVTKNGVELNDLFYYTDANNTRKTIQSGGTFTLKNGQKITITGIPDGASYEITEERYQIQNSGFYMESDKDKYTGTINLGSNTAEPITISCINKEVQGLEIVKEVVSTPKNSKGYMVGEEIKYQVKITNIGKTDITVANDILYDYISEKMANGERNPIKLEEWTLDKLFKDKECSERIDSVLKPNQVAYSEIYSYTVKQEDLGKTLINNVIIRQKPSIPPGEKPVTPDDPSGTITITKAINQDGMVHVTEALAKAYTFTLNVTKNGATVTDTFYYTDVDNKTRKTIQSGGKFTLKQGQSISITGIPDGASYRIKEEKVDLGNGYSIEPDQEEYTGTIDVNNNAVHVVSCINHETAGLGELEITKKLDSYNTTLGPVTFVFKIEATQSGKKVYSNVVSMVFNGAGTQKLTVPNIPVGADIVVTEIYSGASYTIVGSASMNCKILSKDTPATVSFQNTYDNKLNTGTSVVNHFTNGTITQTTPDTPTPPSTPSTTGLTVNIVWVNDDENSRPASVTVQLSRNGTAYGSAVTLSSSNNWSYTWNNLNTSSTWTIGEIDVPEGYTATTKRSGTTVTITATYEE